MTRRKIKDFLLTALTWLGGLISVGVLVFIIGFILVKGIPHIKPSLFALEYTSQNVSLVPAAITTLMITLLGLVVSLPLGIGSAIYLQEYAKRGHPFVRLVQTTTETLSGIPSIVYGLFGYLFFGVFCGWRLSILSGAFTLAIMVLPLIMRSTEEALKAVPDSYREGAFALGAGKVRTIFKIILPSASPGILAGVILSMGRIIGETAALIYIAGTSTDIPTSLMASGRTLSIHMWALSGEGLHMGEAYATAVVLLVVVVALNALSDLVGNKLSRR